MNGPTRDEGLALLIALIVTALLSAMGLGIVTVTSVEMKMAGAFRAEQMALAAADAAAERAMQDLASLASWNPALTGAVRSSFSGGPAVVTVPRRGVVNLGAETAALQTQSDAFLRVGANNPIWLLYAWGWLSEAVGDPPEWGLPFVAVWVSDDPGETDTDPRTDSNGRLNVRAVAYGPAGSERAVDLTVAQITDPVAVKVLAWRVLR